MVFGGRSEIGVATAVRLAAGNRVVLAARRPDDLVDETTALRAAGATDVVTIAFDANDVESHPDLIDTIARQYGPIEAAVVAFGILGDSRRAETDVQHALQIAHTDYYAQISVITLLANAFRAQAPGVGVGPGTRGTIIAFSSVAGVRVRKANYVYGSTKAGLDGFASGLADALHGTGVHVLLARPGFVIGAMTKELMESGTEPAPMSVTADQVADSVVRAYRRGKGEVWIPGRLRPVFAVMRVLPRGVWRRLPR